MGPKLPDGEEQPRPWLPYFQLSQKKKGMKGERNVCSKPERKKKKLMDYLLHGHMTPIDTCSAMHLVGKGDNAFAGIKTSDGNRAGCG